MSNQNLTKHFINGFFKAAMDAGMVPPIGAPNQMPQPNIPQPQGQPQQPQAAQGGVAPMQTPAPQGGGNPLLQLVQQLKTQNPNPIAQMARPVQPSMPSFSPKPGMA